MIPNRVTAITILSFWLGISWQVASANEVLPGQRDQFAGATCTLSVKLPDRLTGEAVRWRLMSGERTLGNGRSPLQLVSGAENGLSIYTFEFTTPGLNEGIAIDAQLIFGVAQVEPGSTSLVIRHADPFVNFEFEQLSIVVIDPDGSMARNLKNTSLIARYVKKATDVREERCVIVGEGIRWDASLSNAIAAWLRLGMRVIALRSEIGSAGYIDSSADLVKIELSQLSQSRWFGSKLDEEFWPTSGSSFTGWSVSLSPEKLALHPCAFEPQLNNQPQTWQLVEFGTRRGGYCLFVGVPIMKQWNQSPVPREFLKNVIEKMGLPQTSNPNSRTK